MSIDSEITEFYKSSKNFYNEYIKNFTPDISSEEFNKFRIYFINLLSEVKIHIIGIGFIWFFWQWKIISTSNKHNANRVEYMEQNF